MWEILELINFESLDIYCVSVRFVYVRVQECQMYLCGACLYALQQQQESFA